MKRTALSKEERVKRARLLQEKKEQDDRHKKALIYSSTIYKLAKISSMVVLGCLVLMLLDWTLPDTECDDVVTNNGKSVTEAQDTLKGKGEQHMTITTVKHKQIVIAIHDGQQALRVNDSIVVSRSVIFREIQQLSNKKNNENYKANTITFYLMPAILMLSVFCLLVLFIKNIEVKALFYLMFIVNLISLAAMIRFFIIMYGEPVVYR